MWLSRTRGPCLGLRTSSDMTLTNLDRRQWHQVPYPHSSHNPGAPLSSSGRKLCSPPPAPAGDSGSASHQTWSLFRRGRKREKQCMGEKCLFSAPFIKQLTKQTSCYWPHHSATGTVHEGTTEKSPQENTVKEVTFCIQWCFVAIKYNRCSTLKPGSL